MTTKPKKPLKKGLPKKKKYKSNQGVNLFSFLNDITFDKKNILTKDNQGVYSQFMMIKWLSMYEPYLPLADYLNQFQGYIDDFMFHKMCIALVPKAKVRLNYIKGTPDINVCKDKLKYITDYFSVSEKEAFDYYKLAGDDLVENIKKMYGII
jgi:hypothetical protein